VTNRITVTAPAKINFRLDVLKKRSDGYHELRMIMQRIDLCDEIDIAVSTGSGIRLSCEGSPYIPSDSSNIVWRAADAILKESRLDAAVSIYLRKRIPVAAGLGGGSSDAASVLIGLNSLLGARLPDEQLRRIALTLGADVPFFISGEPAFAEGVGEILTPLAAIPKLWLLLINPGIHIPTPWAYKNLDLTTEKVAAKLPFLYKSAADVCAILANDLEPVAMHRHPVINDVKEMLVAKGALGSLMSGSGSSVFGIFEDESAAKRAFANIAVDSGWFMKVVSTI
jgi:4-diphosphocytidyl-2-C-methyl-D-erythritol kinase